jgi:4-hydroxy-2-oxoheptanedioate aldolase
MSAEFTSAVVSSTGKTRFRAALERARDGGAPRVGQWMEFPGYTLARTVAGLGSDVCYLLKPRAVLMIYDDSGCW